MTGRVCLVTGASAGIGKATALGLARMGATVVMHGHDPDRSKQALEEVRDLSGNSSVELLMADLSSQAEVRRLADEFCDRYDRLHVLVNNAGVLRMERSITADGLEYTFALNHLAYFLLTHLLLERLRASAPARIVSVSSSAHTRSTVDFDDLQGERRYNGRGAYQRSKLANVLFTYELARRLKGSGVVANCLHPGDVASPFSSAGAGIRSRAVWITWRIRHPFLVNAEEAAKTSLHLAASPDIEGVSGRYFEDCKERRSSRASYDEAAALRLWEISDALIAASSQGRRVE